MQIFLEMYKQGNGYCHIFAVEDNGLWREVAMVNSDGIETAQKLVSLWNLMGLHTPAELAEMKQAHHEKNIACPKSTKQENDE